MHAVLLLHLLLGLTSAASLSRPVSAEQRVPGQVLLGGARGVAPSPLQQHQDTKSGSTRFSHRKRPHAAQTDARGRPHGEAAEAKADACEHEEDEEAERSSAREREAQRHWRFTATRWRDDDDGDDRSRREATTQPLSCFCSAGVICCRSRGGLGVGETSCNYGMCSV